MTEMTDVLDGMMTQADQGFLFSDRASRFDEARDCDGCGQIKPEVDLWAEDSETGEQVWLCLSCGSW